MAHGLLTSQAETQADTTGDAHPHTSVGQNSMHATAQTAPPWLPVCAHICQITRGQHVRDNSQQRMSQRRTEQLDGQTCVLCHADGRWSVSSAVGIPQRNGVRNMRGELDC